MPSPVRRLLHRALHQLPYTRNARWQTRRRSCVQLTAEGRCRSFGAPSRPLVCVSLRPNAEMCGAHRAHALRYLTELEQATTPARTP
jgi:hypothetical protein